jgi:hypothetical protein
MRVTIVGAVADMGTADGPDGTTCWRDDKDGAIRLGAGPG